MRFVRVLYRPEECTDGECMFWYPRMFIPPWEEKDYLPELSGEGWFNKDLFGNKAVRGEKRQQTPCDQVVACTGFGTPNYLELDLDLQREE